VSINYDRIFDGTFLAEETLDGNFKPESTLLDISKKILSMNKERIGNVFIKYLEPLDLNEFLAAQPPNSNFDSVSLKLTKDLYLAQQKEAGVTMNSVVASCLQ
jgi:glycerol-3-phosphate O-acyltransferase